VLRKNDNGKQLRKLQETNCSWEAAQRKDPKTREEASTMNHREKCDALKLTITEQTPYSNPDQISAHMKRLTKGKASNSKH
jgi:hypothetical protein